jgi:hypothetical protein
MPGCVLTSKRIGPAVPAARPSQRKSAQARLDNRGRDAPWALVFGPVGKQKVKFVNAGTEIGRRHADLAARDRAPACPPHGKPPASSDAALRAVKPARITGSEGI